MLSEISSANLIVVVCWLEMEKGKVEQKGTRNLWDLNVTQIDIFSR